MSRCAGESLEALRCAREPLESSNPQRKEEPQDLPDPQKKQEPPLEETGGSGQEPPPEEIGACLVTRNSVVGDGRLATGNTACSLTGNMGDGGSSPTENTGDSGHSLTGHMGDRLTKTGPQCENMESISPTSSWPIRALSQRGC